MSPSCLLSACRQCREEQVKWRPAACLVEFYDGINTTRLALPRHRNKQCHRFLRAESKNEMKSILTVLSAALLFLSASGAVIDLTDETFEHQTQASTGQVRTDGFVSVDCVLNIIFDMQQIFAHKRQQANGSSSFMRRGVRIVKL